MAGVLWTSQRRMRFFFCRNVDEGERKGDSCEGRPGPDDQVASEGRKSIGSVDNGSGSVPHDSRLSRMLRWISNTGWGGGGVPEGIGTYPVGNMCLINLFLVRRYFARRL